MEKKFYNHDILMKINYDVPNKLELLNLKRDILEIFEENYLNYEEDLDELIVEDYMDDEEIIYLTSDEEELIENDYDLLEDEEFTEEIYEFNEFQSVMMMDICEKIEENEDLDEFRNSLETNIEEEENVEEESYFDVINFMNSIKNYYNQLELYEGKTYSESQILKKLYIVNDKIILVDPYKSYKLFSEEELTRDYISLRDFIKISKPINLYGFVTSNDFYDMNLINLYNPVKILFENEFGLLVQNVDGEYIYLDERYNKCDWFYIDEEVYNNININEDVKKEGKEFEKLDEYGQIVKVHKKINQKFIEAEK